VSTGKAFRFFLFLSLGRPLPLRLRFSGALDLMLDLRWQTGGFDLRSLESSQVLNIQVVEDL
jgi:hypothetical protein